MYKRYEKYKPSGVEWLGDTPEHWQVRTLKTILQQGKDGIRIGPFGSSIKSEIIRNEGYKIYGQEHVINNNFSIGNKYIDQEDFLRLSNYEIFPGDIVITMMGTTGKSQVVPGNIDQGIMDSHLIRLRPIERLVKSVYLALLINNSQYILHQVKANSKGSIMEGLNSTIIKSLILLLPEVKEQQRILNFLDHKTALLDTIIRNRRRQIELLQEERKAVINKAVTKGIDPTVRLKPSGIKWLGDIPEHWDVCKLKYIAYLKSGDSITSTEIEETGSYPVYGGNGIRGYNEKYTNDGDFILIGRQGALCGNINYAKGRFWASEHAVVVYIKSDSEILWLGELLRSMNLNQYSQAAAQPGLAVETIKNLVIPVPPNSEQQEIVRYIKKRSSKIDTLVTKYEKQIAILEEYRMSLISKAVTGQIDVREWQPTANPELEELEDIRAYDKIKAQQGEYIPFEQTVQEIQ